MVAQNEVDLDKYEVTMTRRRDNDHGCALKLTLIKDRSFAPT